MLPDIRFAIGAVLAGALLIVTAFGLAATVRIAHYRTGSAFEGSRVLAYAEPVDSGANPDALRRFSDHRSHDELLERLAAIPPDPTVIAPDPTGPRVEREPLGDLKSPEAMPLAETIAALIAVPVDTPAVARPTLPVPVVAAGPTVATPAVATPVVATPAAAIPGAGAPNVKVETPAATPPAVVVTEILATQSPEAAPTETERISPERVHVERVAALPAPDEPVSKAELKADPPPDATLPVPAKKRVAKDAKKKVATRKAVRKRTVVIPPIARTGYPVIVN